MPRQRPLAPDLARAFVLSILGGRWTFRERRDIETLSPSSSGFRVELGLWGAGTFQRDHLIKIADEAKEQVQDVAGQHQQEAREEVHHLRLQEARSPSPKPQLRGTRRDP